MNRLLGSIRGRLVAAMALLFSLGASGSLLLDLIGLTSESPKAGANPLLEEPYQDLLMLLLFAILAIPVIWAVSGWSLKSLSIASNEAGRVCAANFSARISIDALPKEVRPLVSAVNAALDRLAAAYELEHRFVADSAHQLRTPLAVLGLRLQQSKLEGVIDWSSIEDDLQQLNRLVDQLLNLARKEHARQASAPNRIVDLARVVREAAASISPRVEAATRLLDIRISEPLPVLGRPHDLRDMVDNLLENALVHGKGCIAVEGRTTDGLTGARSIVLTLRDEGPGVEPGQESSAFGRFRRGLSDLPGTGLGLAIVKEVVDGHDATIVLSPGAGCRTTITFHHAEATPSQIQIIEETQMRLSVASK